MQYSEGRVGRVFVLRLGEGDRLPNVIEQFAQEQGIAAGMVIYVGGAKDGSRMVVGPDAGRRDAVIPLVYALAGIQEVVGVGTLFPDESGRPVVHLHAAAGREGGATVGCTRAGVDVWLIGEVIMLEILGSAGVRRKDPETGFTLLSL
jgi:predicted DNA-binding protein with PD1-like motif